MIGRNSGKLKLKQDNVIKSDWGADAVDDVFSLFSAISPWLPPSFFTLLCAPTKCITLSPMPSDGVQTVGDRWMGGERNPCLLWDVFSGIALPPGPALLRLQKSHGLSLFFPVVANILVPLWPCFPLPCLHLR